MITINENLDFNTYYFVNWFDIVIRPLFDPNRCETRYHGIKDRYDYIQYKPCEWRMENIIPLKTEFEWEGNATIQLTSGNWDGSEPPEYETDHLKLKFTVNWRDLIHYTVNIDVLEQTLID